MTGFTTGARPTITKDPDAVLDYTWDWTDWLTPLADTIVDHEMVVDSGITVDSSNIDVAGKKVIAWVSGGTLGTTYGLTCRIITQDGRTDDRTVYIKVAKR